MASRWLCPFSCQAGWSLGAGTGFLPLSLGGDGSPPLPCMRPWLGLRAARMPGRAQSQRESHCVSYPHVLFPPAHSLPFLLPARRSAAGCAPGSHKAWHPASDPSQPPRPGSLEGRDDGPHPELAATHLLSQGFGMSKLEGPWEFSQLIPWVHRRGTGSHLSFQLFWA